MKNLGVGLMILGGLLLTGFGLYQFLTVVPELPGIIRLGLVALILGFMVLVVELILERIKDRKEEKKNDFSKY